MSTSFACLSLQACGHYRPNFWSVNWSSDILQDHPLTKDMCLLLSFSGMLDAAWASVPDPLRNVVRLHFLEPWQANVLPDPDGLEWDFCERGYPVARHLVEQMLAVRGILPIALESDDTDSKSERVYSLQITEGHRRKTLEKRLDQNSHDLVAKAVAKAELARSLRGVAKEFFNPFPYCESGYDLQEIGELLSGTREQRNLFIQSLPCALRQLLETVANTASEKEALAAIAGYSADLPTVTNLLHRAIHGALIVIAYSAGEEAKKKWPVVKKCDPEFQYDVDGHEEIVCGRYVLIVTDRYFRHCKYHQMSGKQHSSAEGTRNRRERDKRVMGDVAYRKKMAEQQAAYRAKRAGRKGRKGRNS